MNRLGPTAAVAATWGDRPPARRVRIRKCVPHRSGALLAILDIETPAGMIINKARLMNGKHGLWIALSSVKRIGRDGNAARDVNDRSIYDQIIESVWNFDTVAPIGAPDWLWPPPASRSRTSVPALIQTTGLSRYAEAALDRACRAITGTPCGIRRRRQGADPDVLLRTFSSKVPPVGRDSDGELAPLWYRGAYPDWPAERCQRRARSALKRRGR